jgi:hypothetical protein
MRVNSAVHLDRLAIALGEVEYDCVRRSDGGLLRLRVWHPTLPVLGESVSTVPGPGSTPGALVWWFRCSSGNLLAPCGDVNSAVTQILRLLAPFVPRYGAIDAIGPKGPGHAIDGEELRVWHDGHHPDHGLFPRGGRTIDATQRSATR